MKIKKKYPVVGTLGDSKVLYLGQKNGLDMVMVNGRTLPLGSLIAHGYGLELDKEAMSKAKK